MSGNAIAPGNIYWLIPQEDGQISHPHVVIQIEGDVITLCALTTNRRKLSIPGNILLDEVEGNLPKHSIVEVSKLKVVSAEELGDYIGMLSPQRIEQILAGIQFVQTSFLKK